VTRDQPQPGSFLKQEGRAWERGWACQSIALVGRRERYENVHRLKILARKYDVDIEKYVSNFVMLIINK
jgi:hypothetical protein